MTLEDVVRIENYEWTPNKKIILQIANVLNLHGPSLGCDCYRSVNSRKKSLIQIA